MSPGLKANLHLTRAGIDWCEIEQRMVHYVAQSFSSNAQADGLTGSRIQWDAPWNLANNN
jgi:hypothetical protein